MTAPEPGVAELPSSPGARLRNARAAQGLTEQQVAESLNLDPSVITYLEANDFAALGAPVFVKGHLRRYASFLGLPESDLVGAYERARQTVDEPTLVPRGYLQMEPVRGRTRWPWVVGGSVAFLVAAALLAYLSEHGLPWVGDAEDATPSATGSVRESMSGNSTQPGPASASNPATPSTTAMGPGAASALAPGQVSLQLRFTGDAMVEIFDGSGKAVLYDLGKAGSERTITARAPLSVALGNAANVAIAVNGRDVPSPPSSDGLVARFSVGADGAVH